jgi:hypothetical protein
MPTNDAAAPRLGQDVSAVLGGAAYLTDIERRLPPYFEHAEPRQRVMAYGGCCFVWNREPDLSLDPHTYRPACRQRPPDGGARCVVS